MHDEMARHEEEYGTGWDETLALSNWYAWTGPSRMDQYVFDFIVNELSLADYEKALKWQQSLIKLLSHAIQNDFPLSALTESAISYKKIVASVRNSKESLLAALNACANTTKQQSLISCQGQEFGDFLHSLRKQRIGEDNVLALDCLNYIHLPSAILHVQDFYRADLNNSILTDSAMAHSLLQHANLYRANLYKANLYKANLADSNLEEASLQKANLQNANLQNANLSNANLQETNFEGANLERANLEGANLSNANLQGANLASSNLNKTNIEGANLNGANLELYYGTYILNETK
ncbi:pentapeptide repeat-containing protein [Sulfuricurvum kujiense]|uniref:pentapeptide repeat-containing protein n=1 Tax=Sulfuricurvum kujiense TaxID=148813 RepID=UPI0002E34AAF|nr:pentapeptide repeat-containing protein [Sulfuricurvum kujiense]